MITKIVVLADSECLPRGASWGDTLFEATYPYLLDRGLRERFGAFAPLVLWKGTRYGTTIDVLSDWFEEVELRRAEVVIVQVGGGDCAPRTLLPREKRWIDRLLPRAWREAIYAFEKRFRRSWILAFPHRRLVPPESFRANLREIRRRAEACGVQSLIFVNIPDVSDAVERQLPGVRACGVQYNRILEEEARGEKVFLVKADRLQRENGGVEKLTCDGSHWNARGQRLVAEALLELLSGKRALQRAEMSGPVDARGA